MSQTKTQLVEGLNINTSAPADALAIDSSGRVLVGTTSASFSTRAVFQGNSFGAGYGAKVHLAHDSNGQSLSAGTNVGGLIYSSNAGNNFAAIECEADAATGSGDYPGRLLFSTTADGASSPTERMRIDSSGNVGINQTPTRELSLHSPNNNNSYIHFTNDDTGETSADGALVGIDGNEDLNINNQESGKNVIFRNGGERMRIDSSGRLLVGTNSSLSVGTGRYLQIEGSDAAKSGISIARQTNAIGGPSLSFGKTRGSATTSVADGDELGTILFYGSDGLNVNSYGAYIQAKVDGTPGNGDMPTRLIFATTPDGSAVSTERMRIRQDGTMYFNTGGGAPGVSQTGTEINREGYMYAVTSSLPVLYLNRNTSDGTIIEFRQDNVAEGTISVSGSTVQLNGAHLSRWSQLPGGAERIEILRGTVLSNLDEMCEWGEEDNEQLNRTKVSDVEGDKNVAGVFVAWDNDDDTYTNDFYCAMTGDFVIRIAQGVTVERGDLLMSAGDGTAKPQDDDIIRSKTIAKVTSTNVSCTYDDGSYCVPCVLMAC